MSGFDFLRRLWWVSSLGRVRSSDLIAAMFLGTGLQSVGYVRSSCFDGTIGQNLMLYRRRALA